MVSVSSGPVAKLPVSVAIAREALELDSSADPKIERLLFVASALFAGAAGLGRPFLRQTFLERCNGDGGPLLLLSRWPVESVTSVTAGASDPQTITSTEYSVALEGRNALYRIAGWSGPSEKVRSRVVSGGDLYLYSATYVAGWIPRGEGAGYVSKWQASTTYVAGSFVKPNAASNGAITLLYECTTDGAGGATEPTWPTSAGSTVTDGTVTWTAREAQELPRDIQEAAIVAVGAWYRGGLELPVGIQSERIGAHQVDYDYEAARSGLPALPPAARALVWSYR